MRSKLGGIKCEECQENATAFSGEALDQSNQLLRAKSQVAAEVKGALKTMLTRLEKSANADQGAFAAEIVEPQDIQNAVIVVMGFLAVMKGGAGLDITRTMACIEQMQRMSKLGGTYILRICEANVQMALTYQDAKKACGFMTSGSEEPRALAETLSQYQIVAFVHQHEFHWGTLNQPFCMFSTIKDFCTSIQRFFVIEFGSLWVIVMLLQPLLQRCEELCVHLSPIMLREEFFCIHRKTHVERRSPSLVHTPTTHAQSTSGLLGTNCTIAANYSIVRNPRPEAPRVRQRRGGIRSPKAQEARRRLPRHDG